jgi:NAD(P)H-dependent FMN reductase
MSDIVILAISGSLRARSSNTEVLRAAAMLAPASVRVDLFDGVEGLPHFNPDLDAEGAILPAPVVAFRRRVGAADALLVCSPEYAHGVPGSLKNALDWLVSGSEFPDKPLALFNASQRSVHAQESLRLTLRTMSGRLIEEACITVPLLGTRLDVQGIATHEAFGPQVRAALAAFAAAIRRPAE